MSSTDNNNDSTRTPTEKMTVTMSTSSPSSSTSKLRKIPGIPIQRSWSEPPEKSDVSGSNGDGLENDDDDEAEDEVNDYDFGHFDNYGMSESLEQNMSRDDDSIILASTLGLNRIRTRSSPLPSPLRCSSSTSARKPSNLGNVDVKLGKVPNKEKLKEGIEAYTSQLPNPNPIYQGKKSPWTQSKSLEAPSPLSTESPRFRAILRVTSGRRKKASDVKSFSHELNSKGVRPFPLKKSRALGRMEEVLLATRMKFDGLKEEVNADLGVFAGDLVENLEKTSDTNPEWKVTLEDLLVVAQRCAKMPACEFWVKCEGIVQNLDDRRQELSMGVPKQLHTRLLFILTRCTRLVQFHKESGYEENHILGLHQFSDLGVYPEQMYDFARQDISNQVSDGRAESETQMKKPQGQEKSKQEYVGQNLSSAHVTAEVDTAKSADSASSSYRMSSWKKLPSAADRNRKGHETPDSNTKSRTEQSHAKDETPTPRNEPLETPSCHPQSSKAPKTSWPFWGDHQSVTYENSMICRICEVEIPVVHVEEHSRICTIADRCDLKGLTVNERLERVAETLDKILDSWTPKSIDIPRGSYEATRVSTSSIHEDIDDFSPKHSNHSRQYSDDMLDCVPDVDNGFLMEDLNVLHDVTCETHINVTTLDLCTKASSGGSLTPRSPLLTPRTSQIELLLSGRRRIAELENHQQIQKLLDIAHAVGNANDCDYNTLEFMLERLDELKYAIQDRKADALVVETFGRRIEKLLQEKYVQLCGQIEDEKVDSSNNVPDEDSSVDDDNTIRSLRASPINPCTKDRTCIEDFEIIKPISRGAFGRVFLARKRATGDLFAIKVLKKADMIRKNAVESILAERNILISVRNPFVVRFFYSFTCRENLYLVMEYLNGGDLYSLLRNLGCLDEDMGRVYIAEIVLALEYLHSLNVIHRDLKPDNLLIGQDGHIKLTDFGLSKVGLINSTDDLSGPSFSSSGYMEDDEPKEHILSNIEQRQKHSVVGTPDYLAPEILLGMGHGATADWWSVGIILFELLVGLPPFNAETPQLIFDNIMNRNIPWPKIPEEMSYEAYDLIDKLLTENPVQRLGATGASEVKLHAFFKDINWSTLARQKAMFIPSTEAHDTSYFMSRYTEDEQARGSSDLDDLTDTCSSGSLSNVQDEDGDECGSLTDFSAPTLAVKYSFSNFSYKNLSQLASINYDLVVKNAKESAEAPKPSEPRLV
ncbi:probable serine/threonine protein kinase IRE isoform X1 [Hibiscus syriacus]|uniref:probable serine/threonine protein kinase IRE isoform X1 n=1 Tax=Hibiscus syriacus TaxID=106335 RepID=UPI001921DE21|nr:probable serine/threonine protein kinase IRE isoform X1 [Hibiscus syriacus]